MSRALALAALVALAACGADGAPEPVGTPGLSVSATAKIGVEGTF